MNSWSITFSIYTYNLSDAVVSNVKSFADNTSTSLFVSDTINTSQKLNKDLVKAGLCANKMEMSFNLDTSK